MEIISKQAYQSFFKADNIVLEEDGYGIKVIETSEQKIIKFFRLKSYFSSAFFKPYALRFANNAKKLKSLNIPTIDVEQLGYYPEAKRFVVIYQKLSGRSLRHLLRNNYDSEALVEVAGFIARLHNRGVYFRSLHFGNIIVTDSNAFALIDVADMRILNGPLTANMRVRNFKHLLRYDEDRSAIEKFGIERFIAEYFDNTGLNQKSALNFRKGWARRGLPSISEYPPSPNI